MDTPRGRERPQIRAQWRFDQGGGGGEFTEKVYFRAYGCTVKCTLTPDRRHGSWIANAFINDECVHKSEHDGVPFSKHAAVGAAIRAIELREAVHNVEADVGT